MFILYKLLNDKNLYGEERWFAQWTREKLQVGIEKLKGIFIKLITEYNVVQATEVHKLMKDDNLNRSIGITDINA